MTLRRFLLVLPLIAACATAPPPQHGKVGFGGWTPTGGGSSGTVTSVSGTAPIAVATGTTTPIVSISAIPLTSMATQATVTVVANATGGTAAPTAVALGTGLAFSAGTLTNSLPFSTDTTLQLNNANAAPVSAWEGITTLTTATAGSEVSNYKVKLLSAGAQFTALDMEGNGFLAVNGTATNLNGFAAGTTGITLVGTGANSGVIEGKVTTAGASAVPFELDAWNGATRIGAMLFQGDGATNAGKIRLFTGTGGSIADTLILRGSGQVEFPGANGTLAFTRGGNQVLDKQGTGTFAIGSSISNTLAFYTNNVTAVTITTGQVFNFAAASFSANTTVGTVLGSVGPAGAHTTVQEWFTIQDAGTTRYIPAF